MIKYDKIRAYFLIQNITNKQKSINNVSSRPKIYIIASRDQKKYIKFINKCVPPQTTSQ
jgi:hypothetical protein